MNIKSSPVDFASHFGKNLDHMPRINKEGLNSKLSLQI